MEVKRLYLGNLPEDIDEQDISKKLSTLGRVHAVELKHRYDMEGKILLSFAFVNLEPKDNDIKRCVNRLTGEVWRGKELKVELAKTSFLTRLNEERKQTRHTSKVVDSSPEGNKWFQTGKREASLDRTVGLKRTKSALNSVSNNLYAKEEMSSYCGSMKTKPYNKSILQNAKHLVDAFESFSEVWKDTDGPEKLNQYFDELLTIKEKRQYSNDVEIVPLRKNEAETTSTPSDSNDVSKSLVETNMKGERKASEVKGEDKKGLKPAEEKRLQSLEDKKRSYMQHQDTIRKALSSIDGIKENKRIIFEDEGHDAKKKISKDENKKSNNTLFDDDGDSTSESEGLDFNLKHQFEGAKGQKLLELQSRYASDTRFHLDSRFYESDEEKANELFCDSPKETVMEAEKRMQNDILEEIVGHHIQPTGAKGKYNLEQPQMAMLRFDPTNPEHFKYEIAPSKKETELPAKERGKKKRQMKKTDEDSKPVVSQERFYHIAENLKERLQKNEGTKFSMQKLFDGVNDGDSEPSVEECVETEIAVGGERIKTKKFNDFNPFKYDSSDSEDESNQTFLGQNNRLVKETLFFTMDDPRFREGLEFFSEHGIAEDGSQFEQERQELKQIVRSKVKAYHYNHRDFKNKLGGGSHKHGLRPQPVAARKHSKSNFRKRKH